MDNGRGDRPPLDHGECKRESSNAASLPVPPPAGLPAQAPGVEPLTGFDDGGDGIISGIEFLEN
jgi:hypothetical protein